MTDGIKKAKGNSKDRPGRRPAAKARPDRGSAVGDEMIRDLGDLVKTLTTGGMPAVAAKFKVTRVAVPKAVARPKLTPARIKAAREEVGASQTVFAGWLGVSAQTVRAWEQGTRRPVGAALRLLFEIAEEPDHWRERLRQSVGV